MLCCERARIPHITSRLVYLQVLQVVLVFIAVIGSRNLVLVLLLPLYILRLWIL